MDNFHLFGTFLLHFHASVYLYEGENELVVILVFVTAASITRTVCAKGSEQENSISSQSFITYLSKNTTHQLNEVGFYLREVSIGEKKTYKYRTFGIVVQQ